MTRYSVYHMKMNERDESLMYAPIYWHLYTAEVEMIIALGFYVLLLFFTSFSITELWCVKRENNSVVELDPGTICHVFLFFFFLSLCSCRALPLPLFQFAMCPPQGAREVACFRMHGCERKIQHPSFRPDTHE